MDCIESSRTPSQAYPQIYFNGKVRRESRVVSVKGLCDE